MKIRRIRYWSMFLLGTALALFLPAGDADARGGRGRGGGGGRGRGGGWGGRGGGAAGRAAAAAARGRGNRNSNNKKEQEEERREERMARVAAARLLYAKRERKEMWDAESRDSFGKMLRRVLDGASE